MSRDIPHVENMPAADRRKADRRHSPATRGRPRRHAVQVAAAMSVLLLVGGCGGSWQSKRGYGRIVVGRTSAEEAAQRMPKPVQASPAGLVFHRSDRYGTVDEQQALVLLLAGTERVQAKLRVAARSEKWMGLTKRRVELQMELPGCLGSAPGAGPVAVMQEALQQLGKRPYERSAIDGQALAAAGVIRTLQAMPQVYVAPSQLSRYAEPLALIPPGGEYQITDASADTFHVVYRAAATER